MKARPCLTKTTWAGWDPAGLCSLSCAGVSEQVLVWTRLAGLGEVIDPEVPKPCVCWHMNVSILKCP